MNPLMEGFDGVIDPAGPEARLIENLSPTRLPRHVAIIMDGNGRWASQRGLHRIEGHRAGVKAVKATVECAARLTVPVLTLYAFSSENWKRPRREVNTLWGLLKRYLRSDLETLQQNNIRFETIGRIGELPHAVQEQLASVTRKTSDNTGTRLFLALSYSGRTELIDAFNRLLQSQPVLPVGSVEIEANLYTKGLPDPDLLIRTSGEMRISNFLLWQIAYSEIYVTDVLWPDFRGIDFLQAVQEFQQRERRFGDVASPALQNG